MNAHHHHTDNQDGDMLEQRGSILGYLVYLLFAVIVIGLLVAYGSSFQVTEGHGAIVTRFGDPVRTVTDPGFYWKWPVPIEQVHAIDMRTRFYNPPFSNTTTRDQKVIVLRTYAVWQVKDPLLFFQSVGTPEAAENKLDGMTLNAKNFIMGKYDLESLVSTDPTKIQTRNIEKDMLEKVRPEALSKFGIAVEQIGIKRIAYSKQNTSAALAQMKAKREREASDLRAEGERKAAAIENKGMVEAEDIIKTGREEAGKTLGDAEREAAAIYAKAQNLDPDFYLFWQAMNVNRAASGSKATLILRTNRWPFNEVFGISDGPDPPSEKTTPADEEGSE